MSAAEEFCKRLLQQSCQQLAYVLPFGWCCWVHFFVVEMRAVYFFYFAFKNFITKIAISTEMQREIGGHAQNWSDNHIVTDAELAGRLDCVKRGVQKVIWSLWIKDEEMIGCYRHGEPGFSFVGALHMAALAVCVAFAAVTFLSLLSSKSSDWRSGEYLRFTWQLEHSFAYKLVAYALMGYAISSLGFVGLASAGLLPGQGDESVAGLHHLFLQPIDLAMLGAADMMGLLGSSYALLKVHDPPFNWHDPKLLGTLFVRSWWGLIHQSNDQFGQILDHAILRARLGSFEELAKLVGHKVTDPIGVGSVVVGTRAVHWETFETFVALGAADPPASQTSVELSEKDAGCMPLLLS